MTDEVQSTSRHEQRFVRRHAQRQHPDGHTHFVDHAGKIAGSFRLNDYRRAAGCSNLRSAGITSRLAHIVRGRVI